MGLRTWWAAWVERQRVRKGSGARDVTDLPPMRKLRVPDG